MAPPRREAADRHELPAGGNCDMKGSGASMDCEERRAYTEAVCPGFTPTMNFDVSTPMRFSSPSKAVLSTLFE